MTTIGEILKSARERKKLTVSQVEAATKIRAKFINAIEDNSFHSLPPGTFVKGFIRNYASFLGLSEEETLAFYRRQAKETPEPTPKKPPEKFASKFSLTPQLISTLSVVILLLLFALYLTYSYFRYAGSPTLLINSPKNNVVIHTNQVDIIGKTDPDASLTINNEPVNVTENGSFAIKINLQPGLNTLTVISTNKFRRQTTIVRNLRLEQ